MTAEPPKSVQIWHEGNLIKVGHFRGRGVPPEPIDDQLAAFLAEHMEYDHVEFLHGRAQFARGDGERRHVRVTPKRLWRYDTDGLYVCGAGYLDWVITKLTNLGYAPTYRRARPLRQPADWAELDLERALRRYDFRPGQEECFEAIVRRVLSGMGGVIDATVGFGKSSLIAPTAMAFPKARIVVGVRTLDLVSKTVSELRDYLPSVGQVDGQHKEFGHRVTVYSMDSFEHFDGDADIAFFDEAHEIVAPKYAPILAERLDRCVPIAMTATTDSRPDGADARMEALFGPVIYYLPYTAAEQLGLVVPIRVVTHRVDMQRNPVGFTDDQTARKRRGIWQNQARNAVIADACAAFAADTQVLILVATVEHLAHLRTLLPDYAPVWAESSNKRAAQLADNGLWADFEPMTLRRRTRLYEDFRDGRIKKAVATIWDVGVSFNQLQVLFWARGGTSAIKATQGPGRVSRIDAATGKRYGEVHELEDNFDPGLHRQFQTRIKLYAKNGWAVVTESQPAPAPAPAASR